MRSTLGVNIISIMLSSLDDPSRDMTSSKVGHNRGRRLEGNGLSEDSHYDAQHQKLRGIRTTHSVVSQSSRHNLSSFHEDSETENSLIDEPPRIKQLPIDSPDHHRTTSSSTERKHRSQKSPTHLMKLDRFIATRKTRQSSHSKKSPDGTHASSDFSTSNRDNQHVVSSRGGPLSESSFPHTIPVASSFEELVSFDAHSAVTPKKTSLLHSFGANSPSISPRKDISPGNLPDEYSFHVEDADSYNMDPRAIVIPDIIREKNVFEKEISVEASGPTIHNASVLHSDGILPFTIASKTVSSDTASVASMKRGADDDSVSQATLIHYGLQQPRSYPRPGVQDPREMNFGYIDEEESVLLSFADNASIMAQRMAEAQTYKSAQDELQEGVTELTNMTMRDPSMPMAIGISTAALIGAFFLGPVGVVVGTAAVGISVGFMQIPEAQRMHAVKKLNEFLDTSYQSVCATDSSPCVQTLDGNMVFPGSRSETPKAADTKIIEPPLMESLTTSPMTHPRIFQDGRDGKVFERPVMVMRKNKIIPLNQIHSLDPAKQPRAWLDVLASSSSSMDEKTEAMEEILIWSKDKAQARRFLEVC